MELDDFIDRAKTHTFAVTAMAFQDGWNVDLNRVRDCCTNLARNQSDHATVGTAILRDMGSPYKTVQVG